MRILVVGSGSREHALLWKLAQSPLVDELICAPGNAGTAHIAESVAVRATDIDGIVLLASQRNVDLVVIGPEDPLALGVVDKLEAAGIRAFGPSQAAAQIESSKAWAKSLMAEAGVPTARSIVARSLEEGMTAVNDFPLPVVLKADGLAAGKGVVVATSKDEAFYVLTAFLEDRALGSAASTVLVEEFMEGLEISVFALTDGKAILPLTPASDYKRVFDNDLGPNTGGMGAYAPVPSVDQSLLMSIRKNLLEPTLRAMSDRGAPMKGLLYAGLMLTEDGPKVVEFNARFGDPETQVVLPLLDGDLAELLSAVADGTLGDLPPPKTSHQAAVGVVLASGGYPAPFQSGLPISGLDEVPDDVLVFHGGTRRGQDGSIVTTGGRVLTVVAIGSDLCEARDRAYEGAAGISFQDVHFRHDIAAREIATNS